MHAHACTHTHARTRMHAHACTHTHARTRMHAHACTHTHAQPCSNARCVLCCNSCCVYARMHMHPVHSLHLAVHSLHLPPFHHLLPTSLPSTTTPPQPPLLSLFCSLISSLESDLRLLLGFAVFDLQFMVGLVPNHMNLLSHNHINLLSLVHNHINILSHNHINLLSHTCLPLSL